MGKNSTDDIHSGLEIEVNIALFTVLGTVAILIVSSNVCTIVVIMSSSVLRSVTGSLMVSLATADLFVGITTLIPLVYSIFTQYITKVSCYLSLSLLNSEPLSLQTLV